MVDKGKNSLPEQSTDPYILRHQILEIVHNIWGQVTEAKRHGNQLQPTILHLPGLVITPEMSVEERLRIVDQNFQIYEDVAERLSDFPSNVHRQIVKGEDRVRRIEHPDKPDGEGWVEEGDDWVREYRGAFMIVDSKKKLAILEKYPVDEFSYPVSIEPELLVSRDLVAEQIKSQGPAPAYYY